MSRDTREQRLEACLNFFASVIKSGEPWTSTCQTAYEMARVYDNPSPDTPVQSPAHQTLDEWWQDHLDKNDRNSPEEYPEMALITFEELAEAVAACAPAPANHDTDALRRAAKGFLGHSTQSRPPITDEEADAWLARGSADALALKAAIAATLSTAPAPERRELDLKALAAAYDAQQKALADCTEVHCQRDHFEVGIKAYLATLSTAPERRSRAAEDVLAERERQIRAEGWTPEHDDTHVSGEMSIAAACFALVASGWKIEAVYEIWPRGWSLKWFKPTTPRRNLVKAGALILAEIDRLDRAALRTTTAPAEGGEA